MAEEVWLAVFNLCCSLIGQFKQDYCKNTNEKGVCFDKITVRDPDRKLKLAARSKEHLNGSANVSGTTSPTPDVGEEDWLSCHCLRVRCTMMLSCHFVRIPSHHYWLRHCVTLSLLLRLYVCRHLIMPPISFTQVLPSLCHSFSSIPIPILTFPFLFHILFPLPFSAIPGHISPSISDMSSLAVSPAQELEMESEGEVGLPRSQGSSTIAIDQAGISSEWGT